MIMQVKKILFPTDFSEGSEVAAPYALDLAKHYGARLYLLHVVYDITRNAAWYASQINADELYREMEGNASEELTRWHEKFFPGYENLEEDVVLGAPYEDILRFASDNEVDLIVMSSHSRKGLDRVLFGSTVSKVVKHAHCPVLTVRIPEEK
jgi:nucleotide-binding universal stress UspA family protein